LASFTDILNIFITNSIADCERERDVYLQTRKVKLLCKLLNSVSIPPALHIEIEAFCVRFAKIKEVAELFKLVKEKQ
jgi:hypothetical protein